MPLVLALRRPARGDARRDRRRDVLPQRLAVHPQALRHLVQRPARMPVHQYLGDVDHVERSPCHRPPVPDGRQGCSFSMARSTTTRTPPHGELRDRGGELRDRQPLRTGELHDRRHQAVVVAQPLTAVGPALRPRSGEAERRLAWCLPLRGADRGVRDECGHRLWLRQINGMAGRDLGQGGAILSAMVCCADGGIIRSLVATRYKLGLVCLAGSVTAPSSATAPHGTWESAGPRLSPPPTHYLATCAPSSTTSTAGQVRTNVSQAGSAGKT